MVLGPGKPRPLFNLVITSCLRRSPNSCGDLKSEFTRPGQRRVCTWSIQEGQAISKTYVGIEVAKCRLEVWV